jgi:hypothetical protein
VVPESALPRIRSDGVGMPHRSLASSRLPSAALRTTGANWLGQMSIEGSRFPAMSRSARVHCRIASWLVVMLVEVAHA